MRRWEQIGNFLIALLLLGCAKDPELIGVQDDAPFAVMLPPGAPALPVPEGNPLTVASVALGKALFFDKRLSVDGTIACGSCHFPAHAFSDTVALSAGVGGALGFRNAPSLANVAYHTNLMRDGGVPSLELQVLVPLHDDVEMASNINDVAERLRYDEPYRTLSMRAYDRELDGYVITRAIASYERTLLSGWSRFDRYAHQGDQTALTAEELHGWQLFSSAELGCTNCHSGFDLRDDGFHNIGTSIDYADDEGRQRITLLDEDRGKFKVPTLRNLALTAPYMHDGSLATLELVIDHFASGGLPHPNLSPLMQPFTITALEKSDLIAFLHALTDDRSLDQVP
mgnify:FL=1